MRDRVPEYAFPNPAGKQDEKLATVKVEAVPGLSTSVDDDVNTIDHFINLSSPLRNISMACACPRITSKMLSGVLQTLNTTAKREGRAGCLIAGGEDDCCADLSSGPPAKTSWDLAHPCQGVND
jgi:hypothetical protein